MNIKILLILKNSALNRKMNTGLESLIWGLAEKGATIHIVTGGEEPLNKEYTFPASVTYNFTGVNGISRKHYEVAAQLIESNEKCFIIGRLDYILPLTALRKKNKELRLIALQGSIKTNNYYLGLRLSLIKELILRKITFRDFIIRFRYNYYLEEITEVVAISGAVKDNILRFHNLKDVPVIYCGVDTNVYTYQKKRCIDSKSRIRFLFTGNIKKAKGVELIIKACNELEFSYDLVMCGNAEEIYVEKLIKMHSPIENDSKLVFTGPLSQSRIVEEYHKCDIFIFPSKSEGLGKSLIEAMSCGCPVVVSNIDTFKEIIVNCENGLMISYNDHLELKKAIEELIDNSQLREKCSTNAYINVKMRFSKEAEVDSWLKLLKKY